MSSGPERPLVRASYLVAALTAVALLVALYLTHRLVRSYASAVTVSRDWTLRRSVSFDLSALAAEMTPGVEVLERVDVRAERARSNAVRARFDARLDSLRLSLTAELGEEVEPLLGGLQDVAVTMHLMGDEIDRVYEALERGDRAAVIHGLAASGRSHALVAAAISGLRTRMRYLEELHLARQADDARRIGQLEYVVAVTLLVLIGVVTWYGSRLTRQVQWLQSERERSLRERYRSVFENAPDVISTLDREKRHTSLSPAFEALTGWPAAEWIGRPYTEIIHPDDLAVTNGAFDRLLAGEMPLPIEVRFRTRSGQYLITELRARPEYAGGQVVGVIAITRDITARRRTELALHESEQRLRAVVAGAPIVMFAMDKSGVITLSEGKALSAIGLRPGELVGRSVFDLYPDAPLVSEISRRALSGETITETVAFGGVTLETWLSPVRGPDGEVIGVIGVSTDVTDQMRVETALRKSEEKFAKAFRASPNPIIIARLSDGVVADVNDAFFALTGFARDEVVGRSTRDVLWPDPEKRHEFVRQLERDGRISGLELKMQTKTGPVLDVQVFIETIELNGVPHTLGEALDITERKRAAAALRESEERFRGLIQELAVGVALLDRESRVLLCNPAALNMLGAAEEEVIGELYGNCGFETAHEDGTPVPPDEQPYRRAATTGRPVRGVVIGHRSRRRPETAWLLVDAEPQLGTDGAVRQVVVTFYDITESRRAEKERRRLQDAVMASVVDWTLTFDAVQAPMIVLGEDGGVRRLNAAARDLAGRPSYQEAIGRTLPRLAQGEPWQAMDALAAQVRATGESAGTQVSDSARRRTWDLTANPVTVPGEEPRVILLARDVTDLVHLQESLRRTETMSALGAVVAGVAHEVRNPLFAISATVDAFEARFGAQERHDRYTKTLRQEVNRLSELMHELLEYGKPPRLEISETPVGPIVQRAVDQCAPLAAQAGVRVALELPPASSLPTVRVDVGRMLQVFQNLIENAIQHSPRGDTVSVRGALLQVRDRLWIEITVADSGPGFREEDLPHIFEPFFTRRRGGTGLGLSIVHRIIEQHGGEVIARNRTQGGAMLAVHLAATPSLRIPEPAAATPTPEAAGVQAPHPRR